MDSFPDHKEFTRIPYKEVSPVPPQGSRPARNCINLPRPAALPFSDAVPVGDSLYLSGRIGLDPATGVAPAKVEEELRLLLDGFEAGLAQASISVGTAVKRRAVRDGGNCGAPILNRRQLREKPWRTQRGARER